MTEQSAFQPPSNNENGYQSEAQRALEKEARLSQIGWQQEIDQSLKYGLEAAPSIKDRTLPNYARN